MLALDVARIEAGLLLIDVDFQSSKKALIESQKYSPFEMGLGRLVDLDKARFVGQAALREEKRAGSPREIVGFEVDWTRVEQLFDAVGLPPQVPAAASRVVGPGLRAPRSGRQGDFDDVVSDAQEAHRPRDGLLRVREGRDEARDGADGRGRSASRSRGRRQDALLQPEAQDRDAGLIREDAMESPLSKVLERYDPQATLENAWTIPAPWYVDDRVTDLERKTVFSKTWQMVARADQVAGAGQFVTAELAGEP